MATTIKDIAAMAGVSHQAVSAVLNGKTNSRVSAEKRERILSLAYNLNYRPNLSARRLRGEGGKVIGIVCGLAQGALQAEMLDLLNLSWQAAGYQVLTVTLTRRDQSEEAVRQLADAGAAGVIMLQVSKEVVNGSWPVPVITAGWDADGDVNFDLAHGGWIAAEHLLGHGHRKLGFIQLGNSVATRNKKQGCREALAAAGADELEVLELIWNPNFAKELKERFIDGGVTGIVCNNDHGAGKLMHYLACFHPDWQPAIIGYDGNSFAEFTPRSLTTVVLPYRKLAHELVKRMLARLEGKPGESPILLKTTLWIGESCGCRPPEKTLIYWEGAPKSLPGAVEYIKALPPELAAEKR